MKSIISSTYDNRYLYFIPICVWAWNKLGVDVICFMPYLKDGIDGYNPDKDKREKYYLIIDTLDGLGIELQTVPFSAPEHKEATYAQCSRLYAACLDLPEDEILITGDVDMAMFQIPPYIDKITIFGNDLVPEGQFPMCYASGTVKEWKSVFNLHGKTYQQCLDELLGAIECDHFRGNYWGKDQQTLWENTKENTTLINRARPGTQFANSRYDRDDAYILERLNPDTIDYHMNRPGYEPQNFEIILTILKYHYPNDDFTWLVDYTNEYKKLL